MADEYGSDPEIVIEAPEHELAEQVEDRLRVELESCPDVAFAHLALVTVTGARERRQPSLFVWLVPAAVGSLRAALNLVSEAVARALPEDAYLDVLILNSAPELFTKVEAAGDLVVERDRDEHRRAIEAARLSPADG